jgi:hypothetical protein
MEDFFDWFFGLFVAQPLTEFVTGLPVFRVFRIESSFNSPREFASTFIFWFSLMSPPLS